MKSLLFSESMMTNRCSQAAGRPSPDGNFTCRRWLNGGVLGINEMKQKPFDPIKNDESRLERWRIQFGSRVHEILDATEELPEDRWSVFNFVVSWRLETGGIRFRRQ